jgi:hypothetical protein
VKVLRAPGSLPVPGPVVLQPELSQSECIERDGAVRVRVRVGRLASAEWVMSDMRAAVAAVIPFVSQVRLSTIGECSRPPASRGSWRTRGVSRSTRAGPGSEAAGWTRSWFCPFVARGVPRPLALISRINVRHVSYQHTGSES